MMDAALNRFPLTKIELSRCLSQSNQIYCFFLYHIKDTFRTQSNNRTLSSAFIYTSPSTNEGLRA